MKSIQKFPTLLFFIFCLMGCIPEMNGQFLKKLGKAAERAAERTVERRVEEETAEKTDKGLDEIFEKDEKDEGQGNSEPTGNQPDVTSTDQAPNANTNGNQSDTELAGSGAEDISTDSDSPLDSGGENKVVKSEKTVVRVPDFEPGAAPILEDDFTKDAQGDFPAKWDTNGSGEIVTIDGTQWFRLGGNSTYIPLIEEALPENFTVEFDLLTQGLDNKTNSQAFITLMLEDTPLFNKGKNFAMVELSPCQFISSRGVIEKVVDGRRQIRNQIGKDYRPAIKGRSRISIAVNKTRMRVWMNDNKLIDVPRLVPEAQHTFKIKTYGLRDDAQKDEVYITNFRMGKAGVDNRSKLITEGRLSTNAIQFESGSDALLPESYQIIREIAGVLEEHPDVKIKIIGHTDSEGDEANNLSLSKKRARAVKNSMEQQYGISADRIQTDGKGESEPVAENATEDGMAANRRVEFVKI